MVTPRPREYGDAVPGPFRARNVFVAILLVSTSSCASPPSPPSPSTALRDDAVTVASFNFPESVLLAELYAQAIEGAGVPVVRYLDLGPREIVMPAIEKGLVEFVPEYAGSALVFVTLGTDRGSSNTGATVQALREALAAAGVSVLSPSPAEDQNGVAVTRETADRFGLTTISDLEPIASQLVFGGPFECQERPLCLPGLEDRYGLRFQSFAVLDSGGPGTVLALRSGRVGAAILFSSDGALAANDLVLLEDDRGLQPADNVTPLVRSEALERWPQLNAMLEDVSSTLTTDQLRQLNAAVAVQGRPPAAVAAEWLQDHELVGSG
jgi:osmoprotectant transport system substrate-binding protein